MFFTIFFTFSQCSDVFEKDIFPTRVLILIGTMINFNRKKIKRAKNDPDLIAKPKGGFYKSGQLFTLILITKILDWPSFFFQHDFVAHT